jgi:hypothetical protein
MADSTTTRRGRDTLAAIQQQLDRIEHKLDKVLGTTTPTGVQHLDDGTMFLPGTGTLNARALTPTAQAALDHLEHQDQP